MDKNREFIEAIKNIAKEKNISIENVKTAFQEAIKKAYIREFAEEEVEVFVDMDNAKIIINKLFKVVENNDDEINEYCEISINDAKKIDPKLAIDDFYKEPIDIWALDTRRIVSHILQIFKHLILIDTNKVLYEEWLPKVKTMINAEVEKADRDGYIINLGTTNGIVPKKEAIFGERLIPGNKYNFIIKEVKEQSKDWPIILSRADADFVKILLENSIPEIQEGMIEIVSISRVAGFKTKVIVKSKRTGIDPIGSCIGQKGARIKPIIYEINNEKIEFVEWDENFPKILANACTPAQLYGFVMEEACEENDFRKEITLIASHDQIALLIGPKGKNVRLLSMLFDADIDIKSIQEANEDQINYEKIDFNKYRQAQFARTYDKYATNNNDIDFTIPVSTRRLGEKKSAKKVESNFEKEFVQPIKKSRNFTSLSNEDVLAKINNDTSQINDEEVVLVSENVNIEGLDESIEEMEKLIKEIQEN